MDFLIYIAKSAGILSLFYLIYRLALRKDTFFKTNRFYLLFGLACALFLPWLTFTQIIIMEAIPVVASNYSEEIINTSTIQLAPEAKTFPIWKLALWGYLIVMGILFIKFVVELSSLLNLLLRYPSKRVNGFRFIKTNKTIAPSSFFNYIIFNPNSHEQKELEMILRHEEVHASQWHSLDTLLAYLVRILQWANPFSWFYRKSVTENLEFLADYQTVNSIASKTEYQLALLKASSPLPVPALTNNFYQSFIKKRIIMLNKNHSNKSHQFKLLLILPALALFLWSFNTEEVIEYITASSIMEASESFTPEKNSVSFSAKSSDADLDVLEDYFKTNHPESLIKIENRKRDADGHLFNFSFQVKFAGDKKFFTRFDRTKDTPFESTYKIEPLEEKLLLVTESGPEGVQLEISPKELKIKTPNGTPFLVDSEKEISKKAAKDKKPLGENPLYILNGKTLQKKDLPKNKTLKTKGGIVVFNPEEGFKKYGEKGKDGVLLFKDEVIFVAEENSEKSNTNAASQSKNIGIKIPMTEFKIHKNTSDQELQKIKKQLKDDHGIILNYATSRNNAGEIVALSMNYSGKGKNGNYQVTDDEGIEEFVFFIKEDGTMGFFSEAAELRREERMKAREIEMKQRRKGLKKRAEERREEMEERREEMELLREKRLEEMETMREELDQKREAMREEVFIANRDSQNNKVIVISNDLGETLHIHKNSTDDELAQMKETLAEKNIDFNYRGIKRNKLGEITGIKFSINDHKGSKSSTVIRGDDDEPIETIIIQQ